MPRRFQFSLATIFWLMFLLPASYFVTYGFDLPKRLPELMALLVASFILKQSVKRIGGRRNIAETADTHPLD
jgi:hypothetical protein